MTENRTGSILQRVPLILAVTASSYGLPLQSQSHRVGRAGGACDVRGNAEAKGESRSRAEALVPQD